MPDFTIPEFLENKSVDDIFQIMRGIIPEDIDISEGSHGWNMTRPTALVAAEICEFILPEVIKLIFPEWSYGEFLDGHARARGISRRPATAASGEITITGAANSVIPAGSMFSTASVNDAPSVDYVTQASVKIPAGGTVKVAVECTQTGMVGNTGKNTIVLVSSKLTGITAVTNEAEITGGVEEEGDDSLKIRIVEYDKSQGESFVGSVSDYKRWATSVPGVGEATVIPAQDTSGTVTIILTDANGAPATESLRNMVYNYIMRPDNPYERLAPVNAVLEVSAPSTMSIGVSATVELTEGSSLDSVKTAFLANLAIYLPIAMDEKEIKYTRIASVLSGTAGVNDYSDLKIGVKTGGTVTYGTANIPVDNTELPTIDEADLSLTSGTV